MANSSTHNLSSNNEIPSTSSTIPVKIMMQPQPMYWLCSSLVYTALSKGFQSVCSNLSQPYWAFVYLAKTISKLMSNQTPNSLLLPKFISDVVKHLMLQKVHFEGAEFNYTILPDFDPSTFAPSGNMGPGIRQAHLFYPGNTYLNGIWPVMVAPAVYNDDVGQQAFNLLMTFISELNGDQPSPNLHLVNVIDEYQKMKPDASASAFNQSFLGSEAGQSGAVGSMSYNEVPINKPLLSCFTPTAFNAVDRTRYPVCSHATSSSSGFLFPMLMQQSPPISLGLKTPPVIVPHDFGEWVLRVATWLNVFLNLAANDYQNQNVPLSNYTINMTPQDFTLLMRQIIINIFSASQLAAQFYIPQTSNFFPDAIRPLTCSSGSGPFGVTGTNLLLPQEYWEMLYAATMKKGEGKQGRLFIPLWGVYPDLFPALPELTVVRGDDSVPLFQIPELFISPDKIPKTRKCTPIESKYGVGEVYIDPVDLSFSGVGNFIQGNNGEVIMELTNVLNSVIQANAAFTGTLATVSPSGGILKLATNGDFNLFSTIAQSELRDNLAKKFKPIVQRVGVDPYSGVIILVKVFANSPQAAFMQLQAVWQIGSWTLNLDNVTNESDSLLKLKTAMKAIWTIPDDPNSQGMDVFSLALMMGLRNVHGRNGEPTVADKLLVEAAKLGKGGILTALAGIGEALLGGNQKRIARQII